MIELTWIETIPNDNKSFVVLNNPGLKFALEIHLRILNAHISFISANETQYGFCFSHIFYGNSMQKYLLY